jgi:hypothetical protein
LEQYVENGGGLIGIHGAGDDSHHWDWYEQNLLGAKFSHHALAQQFQTAEIQKDSKADSTVSNGLPTSWKHADEWYVFLKILVLKALISSILWMEIKLTLTVQCPYWLPTKILVWVKTIHWHGVKVLEKVKHFTPHWDIMKLLGKMKTSLNLSRMPLAGHK